MFYTRCLLTFCWRSTSALFNALIFILLPTPRSANTNAHLPFSFTGGLGLSTEHVGLATAIIGINRLSTSDLQLPSDQRETWNPEMLPWSSCHSVPIAYTLLPFLTLLPDKAYLIWPCLTVGVGIASRQPDIHATWCDHTSEQQCTGSKCTRHHTWLCAECEQCSQDFRAGAWWHWVGVGTQE